MNEKRKAMWEKAIAKLDRGEEVPAEDHHALLREGVLKGVEEDEAREEEADLFLRYFYHGLTDALSPIPWLEGLAHYWFEIRGHPAADRVLRDYIAKEADFDHWTALNAICARLHRERQPFPDMLADWAAELHEGEHPKPPKIQANAGDPPYAYADRGALFAAADGWLRYLGMARRPDRLSAIAEFAEVSEDTVRRAIKNKGKRPAPWPF